MFLICLDYVFVKCSAYWSHEEAGGGTPRHDIATFGEDDNLHKADSPFGGGILVLLLSEGETTGLAPG